MTVTFANPGTIDPRLIKTFGVNVKTSDGAIGFFGTGLKYAIAVLIRNRQRITIQSAVGIAEFGHTPVEIRGKTFDIITMNGEELGFTTELGKNWQLWQAYRELWSNCKDEDGYIIDGRLDSCSDETHVVVDGEEFDSVHRNNHEFLCTTVPLVSLKELDLHVLHNESETNKLFYQGIQVYDKTNYPMLYRYNIKQKISLSEDRTLKYPFEFERAFVNSMLTCHDSNLLYRILTCGKGWGEYYMDFKGWGNQTPGPVFTQVMDDLYRNRRFDINDNARRYWENIRDIEDEPTVSNKTEELTQLYLRDAIKFCRDAGFHVDDYEIVIVDKLSSGGGGLGMASRKTQKIYIAEAAFDMGQKIVVGTLMEEYFHLKHNYEDCSRDFQDFLINTLVGAVERQLGRRA